jgi:multidrug resistance efflux pump
MVHKGDLLFLIDPTPYQIKFSEATAQLESARARLGSLPILFGAASPHVALAIATALTSAALFDYSPPAFVRQADKEGFTIDL